jgi:hypothetical protein
MSKTRTFEIELDVPDDFASKYDAPYLLGSRCVITNGVLAWNVYADPVTPAPQWRKATASDEGKFARFAHEDIVGWTEGKLLHVDPSAYLALTKGDTVWFEICEVQL